MRARPRAKKSKGSAKKTGAVPLAHHTPLLNASGVIKRFGDFIANDNVSFSIYEGEIHALLGENGERAATLLGAGFIALAHIRNFRLCRNSDCDHH